MFKVKDSKFGEESGPEQNSKASAFPKGNRATRASVERAQAGVAGGQRAGKGSSHRKSHTTRSVF